MDVLRLNYKFVGSVAEFFRSVGIEWNKSQRNQLPIGFLNDVLIAWDEKLIQEFPHSFDPVSEEYAMQIVDTVFSKHGGKARLYVDEYLWKMDFMLQKDWIKVCKTIGPNLLQNILHKALALFKREGKCIIQVMGYPIASPLKRESTRNLEADGDFVKENIKPKLKKIRRRNRRNLNSDSLNFDFNSCKWPTKWVCKSSSVLYPAKFMYACDLRERWPSRSSLCDASNSTHSIQSIAKEIFGVDLEKAPQIPSLKRLLHSALQSLIKRRRKCCLPVLLNKYIRNPENWDYLSLQHLSAVWVPADIICQFMKCLFTRVTPASLIGPGNTIIFIERCAKRLSDMQKRDCIALHELNHRLKITGCAWLKEIRDSKMQAAAFDCVLMWLLRLYALLIRSCFYVTQSQIYRNRLVYYRKPVWLKIYRLGCEQFKEKCQLKKLPSKKVKVWKSTRATFGPFGVRFVPKKDGVRPIIVSPHHARENRVAIMNWKLEPIKAILRCIINKNPNLLGSGFIRHGQVHKMWRQFALRRRTSPMHEFPLYMVKIDVTACFDRIIQSKLIDLLSRILEDESLLGFILHKYRTLSLRAGVVRKKNRFLAGKVQAFTNIHSLLDRKNRCVLLPSSKSEPQILSRSCLLNNLKVLLRHHSIVMGGKHFVQTRGIAQGSSISLILCNIYLGFVERTIWPQLLPSRDQLNESILLRHVDDFLLATPNLCIAQDFVSTLLHGIEEFDVYAKPEKTVLNFEGESLSEWRPRLKVVQRRECLPWCGMIFSPADQSVSLDTWRYKDVRPRDMVSLRFEKGRGEWFRRTLKCSLSARAMQFTLDKTLNGNLQVQKTLNVLRLITKKCAKELHTQMYCSNGCNTKFICNVNKELENFLKNRTIRT